jgi:hypothetical protein
VKGWIGSAAVDFAIARGTGGNWTLNEEVTPGLAHCIDLDLGFTPSTNLLQLRRLHLEQGESGDAPAAWLDVGEESLTPLVQHYERRSDTGYWYRAPRFGYAEMLLVTTDGFVSLYPNCWQSED